MPILEKFSETKRKLIALERSRKAQAKVQKRAEARGPDLSRAKENLSPHDQSRSPVLRKAVRSLLLMLQPPFLMNCARFRLKHLICQMDQMIHVFLLMVILLIGLRLPKLDVIQFLLRRLMMLKVIVGNANRWRG